MARPLHLFRFYYLKNGAFRDGLPGLVVSAVYALEGGAILWAARSLNDASG
jgi:hypothetical protein